MSRPFWLYPDGDHNTAQNYANPLNFEPVFGFPLLLWINGRPGPGQILDMTDQPFPHWQKKAAEHQKAYGRILQKANQSKLLKRLPALHEEATAQIDCLSCAACCKNYSPRFKTPDIKRIAKFLQMKEGAFIDTYLRIDEDGDYVLQSKPCPFLEEDNRCRIYDVRPSDCARFPYTDEDVLLKRPKITQKNASFCPIVFVVMEKLLEENA